MMNQNFFHDKKKIAQRGFYLVIFLCVVTLAVAGYIVTRNNMDLYTTQLNEYMDEPENTLGTAEDTPAAYAPADVPAEPSFSESKSDVPAAKVTEPAPAPKPKPASTPAPAKAAAPLYVWPVAGDIVTPYSPDELIYSKTLDDWRAHMGIDIRATVGSPVKAMADGEVSDVYYDEMYGNVIVLSHTGSLKTLYCNLSPEIPVSVGKKVKAGDMIGGVGESALFELAEVPHLHLEVLENGKQIDPKKYLK
jgi:murein DD-endopeptidase MepM/ murein hydrolase activator NlpD